MKQTSVTIKRQKAFNLHGVATDGASLCLSSGQSLGLLLRNCTFLFLWVFCVLGFSANSLAQTAEDASAGSAAASGTSDVDSQEAFPTLTENESADEAVNDSEVGSLREPAQARGNKKRVSSKAKPKVAPKRRVRPAAQARSAGLGVATPLQASGRVAKITVEGQRKIEAESMIARLKLTVGSEWNMDLIREDVQALFKSGFFYDVQVFREGPADQTELIFQVVEKPSVVEVEFEGQDEIKKDELVEAANIKVFEILNMTKIRDAVEKIQKLYEDKGYFLARIEPQVVDVTPNETVKIVFKVSENDKVQVRKITFLGNKKLKDGYLKGRMMTQEGGFFSFLSSSGSYKQDAFDRDTQMLRFLYFNEGFVQVKIDRPQVYVTPDKKNIYITIRVEEGEQFNVGEIDFAGDLLFPRDELAAAIEINKTGVFSYETLNRDLSALQAKYGDLGYAFANIIPRTRTNEQERKVDVTFEFDKGNKVYFGGINVIGNTKTRDKVVRRELKIREGELYNETRRRESLENIQRLGFFEEVNFRTSTPPDRPDILNIDVSVKERNTGSIQLGAGYGSATKFTLQGQINQTNFLGKGQKLSAGLNISDLAQVYNLNFTEPYFLDSEWSLGFDVYQSQSNRYEYNENRRGGALRFGHPLGEFLFGSIRYRLDKTNLEPMVDSNTKAVITDLALFPLNTASGVTSSVTGILEYDRRDDRFSPSKGVFLSTSLEYAGLGGDLKYSKGSNIARYYKKLFWEVVWRNNLTYSFINSHEDGKEPPFNELFLLGGPYSLRGYQFYRVGRTVFSEKQRQFLVSKGISDAEARRRSQVPFGGKQQLLYQMEFEFPMIAEAGIKGVGFFDVGQAEDVITGDNFYSNVGFGFRWFSPIGPLRFEWGFPLRTLEAAPDPMVFEFSIGAPF